MRSSPEGVRCSRPASTIARCSPSPSSGSGDVGPAAPRDGAGVPIDHPSEDLARAVAALTPEGHRRVDELLDQLAGAVADREWLVRFARARRAEADAGRVG